MLAMILLINRCIFLNVFVGSIYNIQSFSIIYYFFCVKAPVPRGKTLGNSKFDREVIIYLLKIKESNLNSLKQSIFNKTH